MTRTRAQIETEMEILQDELDDIENTDDILSSLVSLDGITDSQKIKAFDDLYNYIREGVAYIVENARERHDDIHTTYERAITITVGQSAFDIINEILV